MPAIPSALQARFEEHLRSKAIQNNLQGQYKNGFSIIRTFVGSPIFLIRLQRSYTSDVQRGRNAPV